MPHRPKRSFARRISRSAASNSGALVGIAAAEDDRSRACELDRVSVKVRNSYGTRVTIEARLEGSVEELKGVIANKCNVPVDQQRLIHKGRLLVNDLSVRSYGIKEGHAILMFRGYVPTRTASASDNAPAVAIPTDGDSTSSGSDFGVAVQPVIFIYFIHFCVRAMLHLREMLGLPEDNNPEERFSMPPIEDASFRPEMVRSFIMGIPRVQAIIDRDPDIIRMLNKTEFLRRALQVSRRPQLMRGMLWITGRTLRIVESTPEGFNILRQLYEDIGEPLINEVTMSGANPSTSQSTPYDGTNNRSNVRSESAPNTEPLPNPWANSATRSGPPILHPVPVERTAHASGQSDNDTMSSDSDYSNLQQVNVQSPNASLTSQQSALHVPPDQDQQLSSQEVYRNDNGSGNRPVSTVHPEELYQPQLSELQNMGFLDTQENIRALEATAGDVQAAVEILRRNMGR